MSGHHDSRGGDRYAPAPRQQRDSLAPPPPGRPAHPPPSGPSRLHNTPYPAPPPSGPSRQPSSYGRGYDSAPRGPRFDRGGPPRPHDAGHPPPPPPSRGRLSLWSTQNPGGRDGYHHSGGQSVHARTYGASTYRDHDRYDPEYRSQRYSSSSTSRDGYPPPGPRNDSYRDSRHASSSYYPNYSTPSSPPTGPRNQYSSFPPPPRAPASEPRARERMPAGPAGWSPSRPPVHPENRFHDTVPHHDHSPLPSAIPVKPRSPIERADVKDTSRTSEMIKTIAKKPSIESLKTESLVPSPEPMMDIKLALEQVEKEIDAEAETELDEEEQEEEEEEEDEEEEEEEEDDEDLTPDYVDKRIRAIDVELRTTEERIEQIDIQKQHHELQVRLLHKEIHDVPDLKTEDMEEEILRPSQVPTRVLKKPMKKRQRSPEPSAEEEGLEREEEEDKENIRVKIWRLLKKSEIKDEPSPVITFDNTLELKTINSINDLSDAEQSAKLHRDNRKAIFRTLYIRRKRQAHRQEKLRKRYHQQYVLWQAHMSQLDAAHASEMERKGYGGPKTTEIPLTPRSEVIPPTTPMSEVVGPPADGLIRGTRRAQQASHARDYVQSEAEFLELMQSLGAEEKDSTATIPPMLEPEERGCIDFDESGLIADPVEFYTRALKTVEEGTKMEIAGWSEEEDKIFLRRLAISGKQFGRFRRAQPLSHRSVQELVQHYYFLKGDGPGLDWRNVIAGKNRWGRVAGRSNAPGALMATGSPRVGRGGGRGRGRGRGGGVSALLVSRRLAEDEDEESRSAADDDGDDSGSITAERVRRTAKRRLVESTAAKQRPKRTGPVIFKEKNLLTIAPSPIDDPRIVLGQSDLANSTDRDSSAPPGEAKKKERAKPTQTSSYWRVTEMNSFPQHLRAFGRDWNKIATAMGTKTAQQVRNYFSKNADALGFLKIAENVETGRPSVSPMMENRVSPSMNPMIPNETATPTVTPITPVLPSLPPIEAPSETKTPPLPQTQLKSLSVSSLLNSPVKEIVKPWKEPPLAPIPVPPPSTHLPLPEAEEPPKRSPSNISEPMSRSQSQVDYYNRTSTFYNPAPAPPQDRFFREESRQPSLPPPPTRYISPHQNILPPVRTHSPVPHNPQYYNPTSSYDQPRIPPPSISDPVYATEQYSRSPIQHRVSPLPSFSRSTLPSERPMFYPRDQPHDYPPPPPRRYPSFREQPYYEHDEREFRHEERYPPHQSYERFDIAKAERERLASEQRAERERLERERGMERERERQVRIRPDFDAQGDYRMATTARLERDREQRERMEWAAQRERYGDPTYSRPQQYSSFRPRSPEQRVVYNRDYIERELPRERVDWQRLPDERMDPLRERNVRDRMERDGISDRSHYDNRSIGPERWRRQ